MHELSIAVSIGGLIESQMEIYSGSCLKNVFLRLGGLSCVDAESLCFLLGVVLEEKGMKGTDIHIKVEAAILVCKKCGKQQTIDFFGEGCPECGQDGMKLHGNRGVTVESLEIEDED